MAFDITAPVPTDLKLIPDLLKEVEQTRLQMQKETDAVQSYERALEKALIDGLDVNSPGVFGRTYKVEIKSKTVPKVNKDNWADFFGYVQRSGRFDLLQRRLSEGPVMEMIVAGDDIPGVETMIVKKVSMTKI